MKNTAVDVLNGRKRWACERSEALRFLRRLPDRSVDLVFFSPPYEGQRTYGIDFVLKGQKWVDWMRKIVGESARVSRGLVVIAATGPVRKHRYSPSLEWLVADLTRLDGIVCGPAPYAWVKSEYAEGSDGNGTPGSGAKNYQRRDHEPIYAFCLPDRLPLAWTDNRAFGQPPKYGPGGAFSHRDRFGNRANDPWKTASRGGSGCGGRFQNGQKKCGPKMKATCGHRNGDIVTEANYKPPKISNPGNVIRAPVGGGKLGNKTAHHNEAPMTLHVAERFVCWFVPPKAGIVFDPFLGSGTTIEAALNHGRRAFGCDVRKSQVELTRRRIAGVTPALFD